MKKKHEHPKHIVITGASSGIGAALAQYYARDGVYLNLSGRNERRLAAVTQACRDSGAQADYYVGDVTECKAMADWLRSCDQTRPIDMVIANAGISGGTGGADSCEPAAQVRKIFDVNVTGVFNTIDPVLPLMIARDRGQIALMSSLASFSGWPGAPAYSASKGAVRLYGEGLRGSLKGTNVAVSVICPGFIQTPMTAVNDYAMPFMMDADKAATIIARGLARRRGRIAFPWQTYALAGFFGLLPHGLSFRILSALPEKQESS